VKRTILVLLSGVLTFVCRASAQADPASSLPAEFPGTWKLVSMVRKEVSTGAKSDVMGAHPSGYLNYGRDGRMMVMIVGSDRRKPVGPLATPEEAAALIRSMLAYAGTYTVDTRTRTIVHHVDVSWDQARTGASLVRTYTMDGNRLTLITEPSNDPVTGTKTVRTVTWERLK
jgi:hypothetical protein